MFFGKPFKTPGAASWDIAGSASDVVLEVGEPIRGYLHAIRYEAGSTPFDPSTTLKIERLLGAEFGFAPEQVFLVTLSGTTTFMPRVGVVGPTGTAIANSYERIALPGDNSSFRVTLANTGAGSSGKLYFIFGQ